MTSLASASGQGHGGMARLGQVTGNRTFFLTPSLTPPARARTGLGPWAPGLTGRLPPAWPRWLGHHGGCRSIMMTQGATTESVSARFNDGDLQWLAMAGCSIRVRHPMLWLVPECRQWWYHSGCGGPTHGHRLSSLRVRRDPPGFGGDAVSQNCVAYITEYYRVLNILKLNV